MVNINKESKTASHVIQRNSSGTITGNVEKRILTYRCGLRPKIWRKEQERVQGGARLLSSRSSQKTRDRKKKDFSSPGIMMTDSVPFHKPVARQSLSPPGYADQSRIFVPLIVWKKLQEASNPCDSMTEEPSIL